MFRNLEYLCIALFGAAAYGSIEIMWRGYTHPSMVITGGLCILMIHMINHGLSQLKRPVRWILCSLGITAVEFIVGVIVNIVLKLNVWDYSGELFNILGQVCPAFTFAWLLLSVPACYFSDLVKKLFLYLEKREQGDGIKLTKMAKL